MVVQNAAIPPTAVIMSMLHELPETSHVPDFRLQIVTFSLRQAALTHCPVDALLAALDCRQLGLYVHGKESRWTLSTEEKLENLREVLAV